MTYLYYSVLGFRDAPSWINSDHTKQQTAKQEFGAPYLDQGTGIPKFSAFD